MKRLAPIAFLILLTAALLPSAALAKGASEATIEGPGLSDPISLAGEGQAGGEELMRLAESAGFFSATFGQTPDPMLDERPEGVLGPKYTITYVMPGPNNELDELVQNLYPYAQHGPVSYTKPGQRFWTTERTRGGWFAAPEFLKETLIAAGLPKTSPTGGGGDDGMPWTIGGGLVALVAALAAAVFAVFRIRRRPDTAMVGWPR